MTHVLFLDGEQADLIRIAAEAADAMLAARARRVDPDRIISDSVKLQRLKVAQVLQQLERNALPTWDEISDAEQVRAVNIMRAIIENPARAEKADLWKALIGSAMSHRGVLEPPK